MQIRKKNVTRLSISVFTILFLSAFSLSAQSEKYEIKEVVTDLFDGMRAADTSLMKKVFAQDEMEMKTVYRNKAGQVQLNTGKLSEFLKSVGTPHEQVYDERLGAYDIQVHGTMASMQVDYYFFVGETFSHCGVNFIQFIKMEEGWKIMNVADTRNREGCEVPDETW